MALSSGTRLGSYEIGALLGKGGMGEVYRARDTKLGREVAIKVLPTEFSQDQERLARLEREARMLAALNHPNIATIYGLEESADIRFLILELVEGDTLADRLKQGALPVEESLRLALQIAEALEAAHEKGVIHRDLKPANIKVTTEGKVKVLDFGLAKAFAGEERDVTDSNSPTLSMAATRQGIVLGTAGYMSPEQARGKSVDKRADIWSFGVVLYEMLTGQAAFGGDTVSDSIAAVLEREPDWATVPGGASEGVRQLLIRCLEKDARRRLRDIGEARINLDDALTRAPREVVEASLSASTGRRWMSLFPISLVVALLGMLVGGVVARNLLIQPDPEPPVSAYSLALPPDIELYTRFGLAPPVAVSPDGARIVFSARDANGVVQLYLKERDSQVPIPLPETEGAEAPFFSPDGQWVGFNNVASETIWKISLGEGRLEFLAGGSSVRGATWTSDGIIIFGDFNDPGLTAVSSDGGTPRTILAAGDEEFDYRWPQILPDQETILFTISTPRGFESALFSLETEERIPLEVSGIAPRYLPSGHIVYGRSDQLWAVGFDPQARRILGTPAEVLDAYYLSPRGNPFFATSESGVLVYAPFRPPDAGTLSWVDRSGNAQELASGRAYEFPRLSPDGNRIAVAVHSPTGTHDIFTVDSLTGNETRLTTEGNNLQPTWTPDGARLVYASDGNGSQDLFWQQLDTRSTEILLEREGAQYPLSWTPDQEILFYEEGPSSSGGFDVFEYDPEDQSTTSLLATRFNETGATVSPDGRWLAFASDYIGPPEIYLQGYAQPAERQRVSYAGGTEPVFSRDGRELFFRSGSEFLVVDVPLSPDDRVGSPRTLFEAPFVLGFFGRPGYDVSSDGERFIVVSDAQVLTSRRVDIILNWHQELRERVPLP